MSKRIGLPVTLKMRHDAHYVESLTSFSGAAIGRMVPADKVRPNPDQPRKVLGDLRELTESIREKGVLEPLLVRYVPREDAYYIISGERRYHAARPRALYGRRYGVGLVLDELGWPGYGVGRKLARQFGVSEATISSRQ